MGTLTVTATVTDAAGHTASATATATIVSTERERRDALGDYGTYQPTPNDVGCYAGVPRTVVSSLTLQAGQTYSNLTINGANLTAGANGGQTLAPATLINCEVLGSPAVPTASGACIKAWDTNHLPVVLIDSTIHPQLANAMRNTIMGHHVTLRRCDVYGGVDGFSVFNTADPAGDCGVSIRGSWFHGSSWYPDAADGTHNDTAVQLQGGSGFDFVGNVTDGFVVNGPNAYGTNHSNSCIMIKPDVGTITNVLIDRNWFDGGAVPINLAGDGTVRLLGAGITITNNVFGPNARLGSNYSVIMPVGQVGTFTGNVHEDGTPAVIRKVS